MFCYLIQLLGQTYIGLNLVICMLADVLAYKRNSSEFFASESDFFHSKVLPLKNKDFHYAIPFITGATQVVAIQPNNCSAVGIMTSLIFQFQLTLMLNNVLLSSQHYSPCGR